MVSMLASKVTFDASVETSLGGGVQSQRRAERNAGRSVKEHRCSGLLRDSKNDTRTSTKKGKATRRQPGKRPRPQSEKEVASIPDSLGPNGHLVSVLVLASSGKEETFFPGHRSESQASVRSGKPE